MSSCAALAKTAARASAFAAKRRAPPLASLAAGGMSDAEAVEMTVVDLRWQMVMGLPSAMRVSPIDDRRDPNR